MKRKPKPPFGHFVLPDGLTDEYYTFTDGELSAIVERYGGLHTLGGLDIYEHGGRLYPDRGLTPILFLREGNRCGKRVLYGPAIQFLSTGRSADGTGRRHVFHTPDAMTLYPFGFRSMSQRLGWRTGYDMAIIGRAVLWRLANAHPGRQELIVSINKDHIVQGEFYSLKNQVPDIEPGLDRAFPFEDRKTVRQTWRRIGFDEAANGFVMDGVLSFAYGDKGAFVLLTADRPMGLRENACRYFLSVPWGNARQIHMCLVLATSRDEALDRARAILADFDARFQAKEQAATAYAQAAPRLDVSRRPEVAQVAATAPAFLRAMVLAETPTEACIRAATHKYGYFVGWDQLWPAKAFLLMGDWDLARKLLRYHVHLPGTEKLTMTIPLILTLAEDVAAITGDMDFVSDLYPDLRRFFLAQRQRAGPHGLVATFCTFGVDDPAEIGIAGEVWSSDVNGWWYAACRAMENLALILGDGPVQTAAAETARQIQEGYLPTFFDERVGYLYTSVDPKTGRGVPFYQNVSTLVMDTPYGEALLHPRLEAIARFQAQELYHPAGRSAVAYWDNAHEMWKHCIMYQHLVHEMRTARAAGLGDEIERMMDVYLGHFRRNHTAMETHNLVGAEGDITQRANWQAFGTRALYSGLVEGLMGIQADLGGFGYAPADTRGRMTIARWRFRDSRWRIAISGRGPYVKQMRIDGRRIRGTLKVPARYYTSGRQHVLEIERGSEPFDRPTLLAAPGAPVEVVESRRDRLVLEIARAVHTTCKVSCPQQPRVLVDGKPQPLCWEASGRLAWIDLLARPGTRLEIIS